MGGGVDVENKIIYMETTIINLFAGPGAGKTTIASGLMYELKKIHLSVDNPYEFPKSLVWDENSGAIRDQFYVTANQHRNILRSYGKVDYIVCDSPILFGLIYRGKYKKSNDFVSNLYGEDFDLFILNLFKKYNNVNFFLERNINSTFNNKERLQNLDESIAIDVEILEMLTNKGIEFTPIPVNDNSVINILKNLI
jgi:hypothetical protein